MLVDLYLLFGLLAVVVVVWVLFDRVDILECRLNAVIQDRNCACHGKSVGPMYPITPDVFDDIG